MKLKIITLVLALFILWSWVIPNIQEIHWLYFQSASARVCWYDMDGDGLEESGYKGYPRIWFNWDNASIGEGTKCPLEPTK